MSQILHFPTSMLNIVLWRGRIFWSGTWQVIYIPEQNIYPLSEISLSHMDTPDGFY